MLSIQQVGKEILGDNPSSFYVFLGSEYGIKKKYVDHLSLYYNEVIELEYVDDVFNLFKQKHLFAPKPTLYIVRYDNNFIKSINNKTEEYIKSLKIAGTIVCIYEGDSIASKCNKYIPDMSVSFDNISDELCFKYLKHDFKALNDTVLKYIAKNSHVYNMFMNVYHEIKKTRKISSYSIKYSLEYLFSLLNYQQIPSVGDLEWNL